MASRGSGASRSDAVPAAVTSDMSFTPFIDHFILGFLLHFGTQEQRLLIQLKVDRRERRVLLFPNIDGISSLYCDFKEENGRRLSRDLKDRKDNFKAIMRQQENAGFVKNIGNGTGDGREYLKYKVLNDDLWRALSTKYSVKSRRFGTRYDGTSSDTGLGMTPSADESPFNENYEDLLTFTIVPISWNIQGQTQFVLRPEQDLPEGLYYAKFGDYGTCEVWGSGRHLDSRNNIPAANIRMEHQVTIEIFDSIGKKIGECPFCYTIDTCDQFMAALEGDPSSGFIVPQN